MKGTTIILFVIASDVLGFQHNEKTSRPITYRQYCKDGESLDKMFPDPFPYTCKPGPGRNVVCKTHFYNLKNSFKCPGYGYVSGWEYLEGFGENVRCCEDKNIEYTFRDCDLHLDDATSFGRTYIINKGKVIVGFNSKDGGVTWYNIECSYRKRPTYGYRKRPTYGYRKRPTYGWGKQDGSTFYKGK